ncbi:hypothetical protein PYCCODRAFT_1446447 [Trametes coccinea BRFM310]|uniref:Pentacotripeptide-repeat region of PRORP domain-containing protein n=1 Tax=Trametes coccinea (strain BRFM310) TaxID=1353009 RepID=A0A1Y2IJ89_TRAC3|nr:hypothetical protein PYCCODRAFT_1446447 [Trametes coccinea BRFM310]
MLRKPPLSEMEAFVVHRLSLSHHISSDPQLVPLVFVLSAHWLVHLRMHGPLQSLYLHVAKDHDLLQPIHVALLLRVLSQGQATTDLHKMITGLLKTALRRHLELDTDVYRDVLNSSAADHGIALLVERHMRQHKFVPNLAHSRALIRIYGRNGRKVQASRYWRRLVRGHFYGKVPKYVYRKGFQALALGDYLKSFRTAAQAERFLRYLVKRSIRAKEDGEASSVAVAPGLLNGHDIPPRVWVQVVRVASKDPRTPTPRLLALLQGAKQHISRSTYRVAAFLIMKSLTRRQHFKAIGPLLEDVMHDNERFDTAELTVAVEALTMLGQPDVAFQLLLQCFERATSDSPSPAVIETRTINTFMIALLRTGRPDAVFYVWDTMPRIFGVEPDTRTFAILLKAARFARKCEGALQVALQDFGLRRLFPAAAAQREPAPQVLTRRRAVQGLERLLRPDPARKVTGFWRGERAGVLALRLAWRVLLGNWPTLASLDTPVRALRRTASAQALSPVADLYHSVGFGLDAGAGEEGPPILSPADEDGRTYFGIVPHDPLFRALLDLLAEEDRAGEIPRVLAWMRHLAVRPSKATLATALVYWAEVGLGGPLIERWRGEGGSAYDALVRWVEEWVGRGRGPGAEEMQATFRRVQYFREMQGLGGAARDLMEEEEDV